MGRGPLGAPDRTRPLVVGYVREHFMMSAAELARARGQLTRFAVAEGFALQGIYVENWRPNLLPSTP